MPSNSLKDTFDTVSDLYDQVRPSYPSELIDWIIFQSKIDPDSKIIEVGAGTGKATELFYQRGFKPFCVEPGSNLGAVLRQKFPDITIRQTHFEEFVPTQQFDLLFSAQAFHWLETVPALDKVLECIRLEGSLALFWNLDVSNESEFYRLGTPIHEKYLADQPGVPGIGLSQSFQAYCRAIEEHSRFHSPDTMEVEWEQVYTTEEWIALRNTFSPDIALPEKRRTQFHQELAELLDSLGGTHVRRYRTVCVVSKREA